MLENVVEKLFEKIKEEVKEPSLLDLVKRFNTPKEEWEKQKKEYFEEIEEVDKYFEEKEKEERKPILTDEERKYLSFVIKPFKDRVVYIKKIELVSEFYIKIAVQDDDAFIFPNFKKGLMCNGMKNDKKYTLEELGL